MNAQIHPIFQNVLNRVIPLCPLCHKPEATTCRCKEGYCPQCKEYTLAEFVEDEHRCPMCNHLICQPGDAPEPDEHSYGGSMSRATINAQR